MTWFECQKKTLINNNSAFRMTGISLDVVGRNIVVYASTGITPLFRVLTRSSRVVLLQFGHERNVRYATEGPYIFTCNYIVEFCVRPQKLKFRFIRVCMLLLALCASLEFVIYFFFQIEDLSWKFHSFQESSSHVSILKWKFILWVFNEILYWLQLSGFKPPYAKREGPN